MEKMKVLNKYLFLILIDTLSTQIPVDIPLLNQSKDQFRLAIQLERIGEIEKAETIYLEILKKNPKDTRVFLQIKSLYRKQEKYDKIESLLLNRIEIFKNDIQSHVELGELYLINGEKERAIKYWQSLRLKFVETRSIYFVLIQMYSKHNLEQEFEQLVSSGRKSFSDPAFLSLELGNIYKRNFDYGNATNQYLLFAKQNPKLIRNATVQILRMSDLEDSYEIIEKKLLDNISKNDDKVIKYLYSNFLFKFQRYSESFNQYNEIGIKDETDLDQWLVLAKNLRKENQLKLALNAYTYILEVLYKSQLSISSKKETRAIGEALFGLALTYELEITPNITWSPIATYFPENIFFEDNLIKVELIELKPLEETFSLYDSILTTLPTTTFPPKAHYRLGEIKYKITRDFDGAISSFSESASSSKEKTLKLNSNLRLADVFMAKGDYSLAINHIEKKLEENHLDSSGHNLEYKLCQIHLLNGDINTSITLLNKLLSELDLKDILFNDALELKGFIEENYIQGDQISKDAFQGYIIGESLLRQGKRSEAASFFRSISETYPKAPIADEAVFRRAGLTLEFGDYKKSIELLNSIQTSSLGDLAVVMTAEIYDRFLHDREEAARWYFKVLEDFPTSLLVEPVRYRLREITKDS
tara:strand:- start:9670 stop:11604 length:1935 start_codon:yes stop_codon:yes gene_type:complete